MTHIAFSGFDRLGSGTLADAWSACRRADNALIFDTETGRIVDVDPRFPPGAEAPRPGRPKLGVVAREITLLPRHWDWLASQPGGASVALRKLVEDASRNPRARLRARRDALYRLATALVGDAPGYEEAMRALYAGAKEDFLAHIDGWPCDVREVLQAMSAEAFDA